MLREVVEIVGDDVFYALVGDAQFFEVGFATFDLGIFFAGYSSANRLGFGLDEEEQPLGC